MNNLLFMAAELLLLSQSAETGLPLLLIEEPEAHIHPQLQLRMMEFLDVQTTKGDVQAVLTTHSPVLSSKAKLANIVLVFQGKVYSLTPGITKLLPGDYRFLEKFLDATKANLFFARGVLMVEGDAENILLPVIAERIGLPFSKFGVSVVNVGHRGLFRYARIFQRTDGRPLPVPVACVSDRDIPPDIAKSYVGDRETETDFVNEGKLTDYLVALRKHDEGCVKTFVSEQWTLEYDLALHGLASELHTAIATAKALKENDELPSAAKLQEAAQDFDTQILNLDAMQLAAFVYRPLFKGQASKAETAQQLASILITANLSPDELRAKLPPYLVAALHYVTGTPIPMPAKADGNSFQ